MTVSIIIPAFNASQTLGIVLEALTQQSDAEFDVVVVDDASADDTAKIATSFSGRLALKVLNPGENLGRARARNFGIENSAGEIILLLDSDIEVFPHYVSAHVELHKKETRAVGVGALRYPPHLAGRALAAYYASRGGARLKPGEPFPGKAFVSCLASFRRSLIEQIGLFNPAFQVYGGEDLDLGLRFQKAGALLTYLPEAIGYHHHLRTIKQVMETLENYGRLGVPLVLEEHPCFASVMKLDDLSAGKGKLLRRLATSPFFFRPLLETASLLQSRRLPAPLLTYLIYCAYRRGYWQHISSTI